jgi:cytochrome c biogenesis protein ResB
MWIVLIAIGLLAILSVLGAFCGAQKAKLIFNSIPLGVYWCSLVILLVTGFIKFPRIFYKPGLFIIHAGCLLVIGGGLWGSEASHRLQNRFLGRQKIPNGYMVIYEGDLQKDILARDFRQKLGELPFSIKLNDFRLEYYDADENSIPQLYVQTKEGDNLRLIARAGEEISLGAGKERLKIVRTFNNFKIRIKNGERVVRDEQGGEENPAVEVEIEKPDGNSYRSYVFERYADFNAENEFRMIYMSQGPRIIRDYFSDLVIVEDGKKVVSNTIEVNGPLHYGGYHFYQHSYDSEMGKYTILSVTSDAGLLVVYVGYWMLCLGVLWQLWFRHVIRYIKSGKRK